MSIDTVQDAGRTRNVTAAKAPALPDYDVTIIGAGPYGLSAAAYLKAQGLGVRVFGTPMEFWARQDAARHAPPLSARGIEHRQTLSLHSHWKRMSRPPARGPRRRSPLRHL